jgi:hypothetical protein
MTARYLTRCARYASGRHGDQLSPLLATAPPGRLPARGKHRPTCLGTADRAVRPSLAGERQPRNQGGHVLPLYLLQPVRARLADPAWSATSHRTHCMVTAVSERAARERAARALMRHSRTAGAPRGNQDLQAASANTAPLSPWLQPRLVEILETAAATATSLAETINADAVLVPSDPASPVSDYQVLGSSEASPAAPAPKVGTDGQVANRAPVGRREKKAGSAGARPTPQKAAKAASPKRTKTAPQARPGAAGPKTAKPAAKEAKGMDRQARKSRSNPRAKATAQPRRSPPPKRKAAAKRSR